MDKPKQLESIDLTRLKYACHNLIVFYEEFDYDRDESYQAGYMNDVYEAAMKTFFGKDVFDFINSKT